MSIDVKKFGDGSEVEKSAHPTPIVTLSKELTKYDFTKTQYFRRSEFDSNGAGESGTGAGMLTAFMERLAYVRKVVNFPFIITSGFRTPARNAAIGGAKNSYHLRGLAADIVVGYENNKPRALERMKALCCALQDVGYTEIIQYCTKKGTYFVHYSYDPNSTYRSVRANVKGVRTNKLLVNF